MAMKLAPSAALTVVSAILLIGCEAGPQAFYLQANSTAAQTTFDLTNCEVGATNRVPAALAQRTTPTYTTASQTSCYGAGNDRVSCTTTPGQTYGGELQTYDQNVGLRARVIDQCMAAEGYARVTLPSCSDEQLANGQFFPDASPKPRATSIVCYDAKQGGFVALP